MRRDLALGLVLAALGGLGVLWHVESTEAANDGQRGESPPALVCPLGGASL